MSLKDRISSPLEAGTSILDAHHLPAHLTSALEYTSRRLARKALHLTLVVVRRDYQMPSPAQSPADRTTLSSPSLSPSPCSPTSSPKAGSSSRGGFASSLATIRHLIRSGAHLTSGPDGESSPEAAGGTASPAMRMPAIDTSIPRVRWPLSPTPTTPATPATTASSTTTDGTGASQGPNPFGIRLVHATVPDPRVERTLRQTIEKAERKFRIGTDWLSPVAHAAACGLTAELMRQSILQNEVLFSSEGLTLLSLDRVYAFKSAVASYRQTRSPCRLEDAVDELRRCVLAGGRRPLRRSALMGCYEWVGGVPGPDGGAALRDVCCMYRRAYGGVNGDVGIEDDLCSSSGGGSSSRRHCCYSPLLDRLEEAAPTPRSLGQAVKEEAEAAAAASTREIGIQVELGPERGRTPGATKPDPLPEVEDLTHTPRASPAPVVAPASPRAPLLRLQTSFEKPLLKPKPRPMPAAGSEKAQMGQGRDEGPKQEGGICIRIEEAAEEKEQEEQLTARPLGRGAFPLFSGPGGGGATIDQVMMLSGERAAGSVAAAATRTSAQTLAAPMTPNGYDDISPITRGEWGFLFNGDTWNGAKKVAVTTF